MRRVALIASREFVAAVTNRGFVLGLLLLPALVAFLALVGPRLTRERSSPIGGEVAVIDPTGQVVRELRAALDPAAIQRRRAEATARGLANMPAAMRGLARGSDPPVDRIMGAPVNLQIVERDPQARVDDEKSWLMVETSGPRHVALVVLHRDAVGLVAGQDEYGTYDVYVGDNLDERVEVTLYEGLREAILKTRMRAKQMDPTRVEALMRVARPSSVTVGVGGERPTDMGFQRALPFVLGGLLMLSIMIGGQTLLTSTIEEKSSRVIEVLLSAVSPLELMAGKILGQMAVSLLVLSLYVGAGLVLLISFSMLGLLHPVLIVYLVIFFLISYLLFAALFAAVGAAVTELHEAQSLVMPIMLLLVAPWMVGPAIARDPNSTFSVALSFIPPVNTFAMMTRLASASPPPVWQIWLTVTVGVAAAWIAIWCAAKVFKIGLLMHGKRPTIGTLVRWARGA